MGGGALSRAQRAIERGKVKTWLDRKDESEMEKSGDGATRISSGHVVRKRSRDDLEELPSKRVRPDHDDDANQWPPSTLLAGRLAFGFKSVGLFRAPNPMSFARRMWGTKTEIEGVAGDKIDKDRKSDSALTSGDESDPPVTPDDHTVSLAIVDASDLEQDGTPQQRRGEVTGDGAHDGVSHSRAISPSKVNATTSHPVAALTFKPSPFNFARRRWASMSASPAESSAHRLAESISLPDPADGRGSINPEEFFETELGQAGFSISAPPSIRPVGGIYMSRWLGGESSSGEEVGYL
jgi:histone-lysine N-methyltransferase SUV420H